MTNAVIAGVGMVPFTTPRRGDPYDVMGAAAVRAALSDAGVTYEAVQQAYAGYVYGDSTCGQSALYEVGQTGIPVVNVNNNCATGSSALFLARQAVESGGAECALALGFEQMQRGALVAHWDDRPNSLDRFHAVYEKRHETSDAPVAAQYFAAAARDYADRYGLADDTLALISVKARRHASGNPRAVFGEPLTTEEVLASPRVCGPLTRLQCCPPTSGAAAAVVCSRDYARRHGLRRDVSIAGQAMVSDTSTSFDPTDLSKLVGFDISRAAADQVYESSGVSPQDIRVVELHDCFTINELLSYESLRLTPEGTGERFVLDGDNSYGGRVVTNPSGGLLSKGHPLGATGIAQCAELVWQLRAEAGDRQVDGATLALQHNVGLGGAAVVTLYEKR